MGDVIGRGDSYSCEALRMQNFLDNRLKDGSEVVSLTLRSCFNPPPPKEYSSYSFLLAAV
jgi:hypothetical protein